MIISAGIFGVVSAAACAQANPEFARALAKADVEQRQPDAGPDPIYLLAAFLFGMGIGS